MSRDNRKYSERILWNSCNVNCGSRCALRVHVENGIATQIESDSLGDDHYGQHQLRACPRGRNMRQFVYDKDRILYPMRRTGPRGEGRFERITWQEAYAEIAKRLRKTLDTYGNEAVYINHGSGSRTTAVGQSWPVENSPVGRLMNVMGGYLNHYGDYSAGQISVGMAAQFGSDWAYGSVISTMRHSKLAVFFGQNPSETRMSGTKVKTLQHAMQNNTRVIIIDPRFSDTMVSTGSEWIPIRPATDAALCSALAYVMITEDLVDMDFIKRYTVGYDDDSLPQGAPPHSSYRSYILGLGPDAQAKSPAWAEPITGIPAARIKALAREIAAAKPCFISQGWGPQRTTYGEDASRAIAMLAILTGNIGIAGGNTGAREYNGYNLPMMTFPTGENPVKTAVSHFNWYEAIEDYSPMTAQSAGIRGRDRLIAPIKFIWNYAGNGLTNQHGGINQMHCILSDETKCETIIVMDTHHTSSAKYADILLPCCTSLEEYNWSLGLDANMGFAIFSEKCIEPVGESKTAYDMCADIAYVMGKDVGDAFTEGRSHYAWLEYMYTASQKIFAEQGLPPLPESLEDAFAVGIYRYHKKDDFIAYEDFRSDPEANPLDTPSGKIEIYSTTFAQYAKAWSIEKDQYISPIPEYRHDPEGSHAALQTTYPLQLIGHHYKQRTHSSFGNCPWLQEVAPQMLWINPLDAEARHIAHGDMVKVYNDRGASLVPAKVTPRIMPGVVSLPQGAWHRPKDGIPMATDTNGCINVLTKLQPTALSKSNPHHSNLVEVVKEKA